jgi:hypothetical protein
MMRYSHSITDLPVTYEQNVSSAGRGGLVITVWFPYRRWFLLVILNLSATITVRAVLTIIYPATAVTTWASLHCQNLLC